MDESATESTEDNDNGLHSGDNHSLRNTNTSGIYHIRDDIGAEREAQYILSNRMAACYRIDFAIFYIAVQLYCS